MKERVIENWLDKASEKSFQKPFCYILSNKGYKIIHMSRHCSMELGKDIIAISPENIVCAFQLKKARNGSISLSDWRDINSQVIDLATLKIKHPSINTDSPHKSFFVTNGNIEEEVQRTIDDLSDNLLERGTINYKIETIVKGQLLSDFINIENDLIPSELDEIKTLLELHFAEGNDLFPRDKLSLLFESIFKLDNSSRLSRAHCLRIISSSALLCTLCLSNYCNSENHLAEIQAWVIYLSYTLALAEKYNIPFSAIEEEINIANLIIYNTLENLVDELMERDHLVEGDALVDQPIYRARINWLISLLSIFGLWRKIKGLEEDDKDIFIQEFIQNNHTNMWLWGEGAVSQFISFFWYYRKINATTEPDFKILYSLIETISKLNKPRGREPLQNVYYVEEDVLNSHLGFIDKSIEDTFAGTAYTLEPLVYLFVRRNWKQNFKWAWPAISRISVTYFKFERIYDYYRWNNNNGTTVIKYPHPTQDWSELRNESFNIKDITIPQYLKNNVIFSILFLCVYPHRVSSDIVRWIDSIISDI